MELRIILEAYKYSEKLGDITLKVAKSVHGVLLLCV